MSWDSVDETGSIEGERELAAVKAGESAVEDTEVEESEVEEESGEHESQGIEVGKSRS